MNYGKMMKRLAWGLAITMGIALAMPVASAQPGPQGPEGSRHPQGSPKHSEEVRNMKIAFFTEALQMTPEQSQRFWPVYNKYWGERREVGRKRRDLYKAIRETKATDVQLRELVTLMQADCRIVAAYIPEFKKVLAPDKVARIFVTDEDFKNFLIRKATEGKK